MIYMKRVPLALALAIVLAAPIAAQDADESVLDQFDQAKPQVKPAYDSPASIELRDAVRRMALRPSDPAALTDAGHASLKLGDAAAAFNFLTRANSIQPGNSRTIAGLGSAMVRTENPFEALRYFDDAIRLGATERSIALDRALAFDLLGNFTRAHQDYQLARSFGDSDDLTRRYAMSLSMAGKVNEADGLLVPLLQRNDPEAWRARSMMLAARGNLKEAMQIAEGFLSPDSARRMEGFLRQMPRMTDAQRAAAMHFGHFPVGRIGEDTPELRQIAAATGTTKVASAATGQDRLIPSGQPLGNSSKKPSSTKKDEKKPKPGETRVARNDAKPGFSTASAQQKVDEASKAKQVVLSTAQLPPPDAARAPVRIILPGSTPPPSPPPSVAIATPTVNRPASIPAETSTVVTPKSAIDEVRQRQVTASEPIPAPVRSDPVAVTPPAAKPPVIISAPAETRVAENLIVEPAPQTTQPAVQGPVLDGTSPAVVSVAPVASAEVLPPVTLPPVQQAEPVKTASFDLDALVQSIEIPESEQKRTVAPVDLKAIQKAQAKADTAATTAAKDPKTGKPKVEPKAPPQPARIWVQVATGAEAALGGDYRRFAKKSPELFKGKEGWTSVWGKSSRLLVGPFADAKTAKKWEADYRKAGGNGFVWNSENGIVVKKLGGK
ncbi:MAG: hypothetical protein WA793_09390 [Sphingorhabdus sp.]|uniref:tetratricopeptide repeat protein n=1 Tax=Sphingorhabdus sp. TaxID=1902408 RepID=UPI003CA591F6